MRMQDLTVADAGWLTIVFLIYFLPFFIACIREHKNRAAILLLNLFLGWTGLGWLGVLIWSMMK